MKIFELSDADNERWDNYISDESTASIYHLSGWRNLIQEQFGHQACYFYAESEDGVVEGVLPLIRLKSLLFGDYMVSVPYFNYGGVIARDKSVEDALIEHAYAIGNQLGVSHIEFRDTVHREQFSDLRTDKVAMVLELPELEEELWQALGSKRRAQIKRPLRENPEVHQGGLDLLDDFYRVFAINMRDLGTPVYSKKFFSAIIETFPSHCRLIVIRLQGKAVAAAFLIGYKDRLEIPWASTLRSVNSSSMNMLLYWEVIKYAIQSKFQCFDFGRSSVDSGTFRFKKQWGAVPQQLYWHYWLKEGEPMPQLSPSNPAFQLAIRCWQKLPLFVSTSLGPGIVKNLP
ncbi:MAG: FemAB family PEP-CTERM system-associated protein [Gammaproteobacteria bacterium]|nr:FemAB family PEP-CTERM system-associated protein [Gammaproteobacteria bacterium]